MSTKRSSDPSSSASSNPSRLAEAPALEWSGVEAYQGKEYLQSDEVVAGRLLPLTPAIGKAGEA